MAYDVFISYSHAGDDLLSERVQEGLARFAKPWWRRRALKVFRDRTALSANPGLWTSIAEAIDESRFFLMLASPEAAASPWCQREVEQWRSTRGLDGLLLLLTDGEILWDDGAKDFDWARTTALGAAFAGCFTEEPRHVDMRWARSEVQLDLSDGRFRDQIAELAAPVHGVAKDELAGADVRQHRRTLRHAFAAGIALVALTIASIATSVFAVNAAGAARRSAALARVEQHNADVQALNAQQQRKRADSARLVALRRQREAQASAKVASQQRKAANHQRSVAESRAAALYLTNLSLNTSNTNLNRSSLTLAKADLLAEARLAARRSEQLLSSGDQTYQLGLALAAEAVRHASASNAVDPSLPSSAQPSYPDPSCSQSGLIDPAVGNTALLALANAGGRFVTAQLAGNPPMDPSSSGGPQRVDPVAWSADGSRLATYSGAQAGSPGVVQVWRSDGSLVANVGVVSALTTQSALSDDGNVLAVTSDPPGNPSVVSAWSLSSGQNVFGHGFSGRRPALSGDGRTRAWLSADQSHAVAIGSTFAPPRRVMLPGVPVAVAVSPDGSLVGPAVVQTTGDSYALVPIEVATGIAGRAVDLGSFANPNEYPWSNPPMVRGATTEPPAARFAPSGGTMWIYNNEQHVAVQLRHGVSAPVARRVTTRPIQPWRFDLTSLQASTPDGRTLVFAYNNPGDALLQVSTLDAAGWHTSGLAPLKLCASNECQLSISPNGDTLAVRSLSALQVINLRDAGTSSSRVTSTGGGQADAIASSPNGANAVRWNARTLGTLNTLTGAYQRLSVAGPGEQISAVGFTPAGRYSVALVSRGSRCPCRIVILDAATGRPVRELALGATALDSRAPTAVAMNDAADLAAVTFDDHPDALTGAHRSGLATYSADTGQPLQVDNDAALGLGDRTVSVPAFQPGGDTVALVATATSGQPTGVLMNARTGAVNGRVVLRAGAVTVPSLTYSNGGYALRFSPDGRLLAWNRGGSVVLWSVGGARGVIASQAVLTSSDNFDPTALAVSDNGAVATVGVNVYGTSLNRNYAVVLVGDQLGRYLQPLGVARFISSPVVGQMSVAAAASGELSSVAIASDGSRVFTDFYGASPASLLQQLCTAASVVITPDQWQTYFPGEPYRPACTPAPAPSPWTFDVPHGMAVQAVALPATAPGRVASPRPAAVKAPSPRTPPVEHVISQTDRPSGALTPPRGAPRVDERDGIAAMIPRRGAAGRG